MVVLFAMTLILEGHIVGQLNKQLSSN